ncbi:MAG TPA: DUF3108 domain-containing protein [Gammaproteobacteria bacterium]|nr:DUF3108 domain-containing protein [Gammaproteobacteria bacterium]
MTETRYNMRKYIARLLGAGSILLALCFTGTGMAGGDDPYPEFIAYYDASANGLGIGSVEVRLTRSGADEYLYEQKMDASGLAALFGPGSSSESSRWRYLDNRIQVIEYRSQQDGGDDEANAHLSYDWEALRVKNTGAGKHWEIAMPEDTIDRLVMQLAMLFELRDGKTTFSYRFPRKGRIKQYDFKLVGEDTTELDTGRYRTLKVARTDDKKDKSWVWIAPQLDYFPVRFVKQKKTGVKIDLRLRKVEFLPGDTATGSAPPVTD